MKDRRAQFREEEKCTECGLYIPYGPSHVRCRDKMGKEYCSLRCMLEASERQEKERGEKEE